MNDKEVLEPCKVTVWTDYGTEYDTKGLLSGDTEFCYLPNKGRLVIKPNIIRRKDKPIVYAPEKTYGNIDRKFLIELAKAQKYTVKLMFTNKDGKIFETITECTGSIDPKIFDHDLSPKMGSDSANVVRTKILSVLSEMDDKERLTTFLFGSLAGLPLGIILAWVSGALF